MQVEYATDLVFRAPAILKPLYEQLSRQAILTVKAEHVATFLGNGLRRRVRTGLRCRSKPDSNSRSHPDGELG
jgi:hypothetical protein